MKQVLLMIAVVALVGCGEKELVQPYATPPPFEETKAKAESGDACAQDWLRVMYAKGQGVEQDFKEAVKWYQKAADQGDARGQTNLGLMYDSGDGVLEDDKEAVK
jgi:TPR repeat protein